MASGVDAAAYVQASLYAAYASGASQQRRRVFCEAAFNDQRL